MTSSELEIFLRDEIINRKGQPHNDNGSINSSENELNTLASGREDKNSDWSDNEILAEETVSSQEGSPIDMGAEQQRVCKVLKKYTQELQLPERPSESKVWIVLKALNVILSFLSSKAYVSGCKEAFPNREVVAYVTAFCSAVTSALPTLWAGFSVIDRLKPDDPCKKELLDLQKNYSYYVGLVWPSLGGALAAVPFADLTAKTSTSGMVTTLLWTLNSWVVNATLTVFAMQNLTKKIPRKLTLSKEDEDIAYKVRAVFLKRLKAQQGRVAQGEFNDRDFTLHDLLKDTTPEIEPRWLGSTIFRGTGVTIALLGLVGYSSLAFSSLDNTFNIPVDIVDVITKVGLTAATMVPFASLFINAGNEVFSTIYEIAESLYDGRFGEVLAKNPAYQFYPKAAIIGTVTLLTMATLSGVTNGDMTRKMATDFFEKISLGTVHIPTELADFFGADAYATSAMFNGSASIFGAYHPFLAALAGYCLSGDGQKSALKLKAFNTFVATLEEMSLEDSALMINSLDERTNISILEEADKELKLERWQVLVDTIEGGFADKKDLEAGLHGDAVVIAHTPEKLNPSFTGSINGETSVHNRHRIFAKSTNVSPMPNSADPTMPLLLSNSSDELENSASCGRCAVM
jgi:hypothetical protein